MLFFQMWFEIEIQIKGTKCITFDRTCSNWVVARVTESVYLKVFDISFLDNV